MSDPAHRAAALSIDLAALTAQHAAFNQQLQKVWNQTYPESTAAVAEFVIHALGDVKRKLLRRWPEETERRRGVLIYRVATSFEHLTAHSVEHALNAIECGGRLAPWRLLPRPLTD